MHLGSLLKCHKTMVENIRGASLVPIIHHHGIGGDCEKAPKKTADNLQKARYCRWHSDRLKDVNIG